MAKTPSHKRQYGFSLIELLLVLAIVAALAVAAFIVYPRVQAGRNAAYEAQVLTAAQANIKALFTTNNYRNINETVAINAGVFPKNMQVSPTSIQNQWGGNVWISPSTSAGVGETGSAPQRYFRIIYTQVPTDVCIRLAGAAANNFGTIRVSNEAAADSSGWEVVQDKYSSSPIELNEASIATKCKGTGGRASITFVSN